MEVKQVILIRRDLKMRRGKEIAQGSHASMAFLVHRLRNEVPTSSLSTLMSSKAEKHWVLRGMRKVCLQVHSEEQLVEIHEKALSAGLTSHMILDSGKTEFGGVPTHTACAIGPNLAEEIDQITGELKLY